MVHAGAANPGFTLRTGAAGVLVGLRQYSAPAEGRGAQRSTSLERWLADAQASWR